MKKILTITIAMLLTVAASAQLRIEVAGNYGGFSRDAYLRWSIVTTSPAYLRSGLGFSAGAMYDINLMPDNVLYIEPGALYMMSNVEVKSSNAKIKTQWIQVPLVLGSDVPIGSCSFNAAFGLYYGRAFKQEFSDSQAYDSQWIIRQNDFGVCARAGFTLPFGIGLFIGYTRGVIDLSNSSSSTIFNSQFKFGISYKLPR